MLVSSATEAPVEEPGPIDYGPEFGTPIGLHLWSWVWTVTAILKLWMVVECLRKDPDRGLWLWVILLMPFGETIYFFARWLPGREFQAPAFFRRWTKRREIERLEIAARQIGNAHQFVAWGDALREAGRDEEAARAYADALRKDPECMPALWGAALVEMRRRRPQQAHEHLRAMLARDPQYKFGDVSLYYGKTLYETGDADEARAHLERHSRRWRHPEGLLLLATIHFERGEPEESRRWLQELLMDVNAAPAAIARRQAIWKRRAKKLLKRL